MNKTLLAQGNLALKKKDYDVALDYYQRAAIQNPSLNKIINVNISILNKMKGVSDRSKVKQSMEKTSVDIVVPVFNALDDVSKCLESLLANTDDLAVRVIVVNDGSDEKTTEWLRGYCRNKKIIELVEHGDNRGYTKAVNTGLRKSTADYVVTQNSDTIVSTGWLKGMLRCFDSSSKIGVVGPLSNAASWQNVPNLRDAKGNFAVNDIPAGYSIDEMAKLVFAVSKRIYPRMPFVNGFCFMIKRELINQIGYMDEEIFPIGYGEENDFCIRAVDAGFELAIADDVYVFHAKSKSFGHDRRKGLSEQGTKNLKFKHGEEKYFERLEAVKKTKILDGIRSRIVLELNSNSINDSTDLMRMRILFLLPVKGGGGGVHSVVQEVNEMRRLGLNVNVGVKQAHIQGFCQSYADISNVEEIFVGFEDSDLIKLSERYDIVVGTIFTSMKLVKRIIDANPHILPAYYVQDYESLFFDEGSENWIEARQSYTLVSGALIFAKTQWIVDEVQNKHNVAVHKVRPSIDHDVYKPSNRINHDRIVVSAMIRPQTPRRGADRTMRLLAALKKAFSDKISINTFGCESDNPDFLKLERDFTFVNHGSLMRPQVAELLSQSDLFIDLSDYQAFGRTALEAMACGCAAIVPKFGGAYEYAIHNVNSLILDPFDENKNFDSIFHILSNSEVLRKMKRSGLQTASNYSVHSAAVSEILVMEEALKIRRVSHSRFEKKQLYLLPELVSDGVISATGYERINIPYQCPIMHSKWQHIQISNLPLPESASVIVIQGDVPGVTVNQLRIWLTAWKTSGGKLVYEIDEKVYGHLKFRSDIDSVDSEFVANKVGILAINADVIHVPTVHLAHCLATYNKNIRVIPCALDSVLWRLDDQRRHDKGSFRKLPNGPVRIGYIGTDDDYENINSISDAMRIVIEKYGSRVEIEVIGGYQRRKEIFGKRVGLPKKSAYLDYINWLQERVHWDIGIIPLASSGDYIFDSSLQFLKYSALDLAIVASDQGQYIDIAKHMHNALVVSDSTDAWVDAISKLVDDASLRTKLASMARNDLRRFHTFESVGNLIDDSLSILIN